MNENSSGITTMTWCEQSFLHTIPQITGLSAQQMIAVLEKTLKPAVFPRHYSRLSTHIGRATLFLRGIAPATKKRLPNLKAHHDSEAQDLMYNLAAFLSRLAWHCRQAMGKTQAA